jgi:hypothetical protein
MSIDGLTNLDIQDRLLARGFGRRDGLPPKTYSMQYHSSEVIEAVRTGNPCLKMFLDSGLALECEEWQRLTAIIYAIDLGEIEAFRLLIEQAQISK